MNRADLISIVADAKAQFMGRRLGIFGSIARDLERASARAAADSRRHSQRSQAMRARAYEREIIRKEREHDRAKVRAERAAERQRIEREKATSARLKKEAKQAELAEQRLLFEESQEQERAIDSIANDAPEVEDRDRFYSEMLVPQDFEAAPFVPPPEDTAAIRRMSDQGLAKLEELTNKFVPYIEFYYVGQIACLALTGGGMAVWLWVSNTYGPLLFLAGCVALIVTVMLKRRSKQKQIERFRSAELNRIQAEVDGQAKSLRADQIEKARRRHEAEVEESRQTFAADEAERIRGLQDLVGGATDRIAEVVDTLVPLSLPVEHKASVIVRGSRKLTVNVEAPAITALPTQEVKLLASGKASYKNKPTKRLHEQYERLIAGLAFRYASELMLYVPTCQEILVVVSTVELDPATGNPATRKLLDATFSYAMLAPLSMDSIDPVAALVNFPHEFKLGKGRS